MEFATAIFDQAEVVGAYIIEGNAVCVSSTNKLMCATVLLTEAFKLFLRWLGKVSPVNSANISPI